ncbi:MAG: phosphatidylserine decarboxylase [Proteobacteria bacterium]|nr:phosphatidylserine decarboxylase [Pseudomonadota bacterium]MBU1388988.1 phosphatidylserine decarboxylase [Pseudomonadota bacterium]MBU1543540.1 phosphatidylserine decarboxylase [Pseudomonadota bacterium]MBU2480658.1 phosphatidylserine decarboxylase [Pseudomonadota bacterium]
MTHITPDIHQYIDRRTHAVKTETLFFDRTVQTIYSTLRENSAFAFNLLVSARFSSLLGFLNYDFPIKKHTQNPEHLFHSLGINTHELYDAIHAYDSYRKIFERRIKYWEFRPMNPALEQVVSPADSRVLIGSFQTHHALFVKNKFFNYDELVGEDKTQWLKTFEHGDFAVFRLTPDKYHYNHCPVSGRVLEIYEIDGKFHSCNPGAVVKSVTPYSKNRRVVTIIDTDVEGGTRMGKIAMIEIVALMIGKIVQRYSENRYDAPAQIHPGQFIQKGQPKSLFRPGSSTTVLIFEKNRINFSQDLVDNLAKPHVKSRFTTGFGKPMVETDIQVRQTIGTKK